MKLNEALRPGQPTVLEQLLSSALPTVIYGAGYCARSLADALLAEGKPAVCCTVDRKWIHTTSRCGALPVVPLEDLHHHVAKCNIAVAIGTSRPNWSLLRGIQGVHNVFGNIGLARGLPMTRAFIEDSRDHIERAYHSFSDDASRIAFSEYLTSRLFGHTDDLPSVHHANGWFTSVPLNLGDEEVLCDCGAYDGDTIALFLQTAENFKYIYAWEPDQINATKLQTRLQTVRLNRYTILQQCAASFRGELRFSEEGAAVSAVCDDGPTVVPCDTIDSNCPDTTLLKVDVEGAELDVLRGATQTIKTSRASIIAAVYHRRADCFELPTYINSLTGDGKIYFRWMRDCPDDVLVYMIRNKD